METTNITTYTTKTGYGALCLWIAATQAVQAPYVPRCMRVAADIDRYGLKDTLDWYDRPDAWKSLVSRSVDMADAMAGTDIRPAVPALYINGTVFEGWVLYDQNNACQIELEGIITSSPVVLVWVTSVYTVLHKVDDCWAVTIIGDHPIRAMAIEAAHKALIGIQGGT